MSVRVWHYIVVDEELKDRIGPDGMMHKVKVVKLKRTEDGITIQIVIKPNASEKDLEEAVRREHEKLKHKWKGRVIVIKDEEEIR